MFDLFPDGPVHEYPPLVNITFSFLWAFLLASVVAITHRLTFTGNEYPRNFFQSLILGAIITTMVMMAIGDSLARGLGVFGAMAIIRFRTRIDDPRDVLFLFAALSTGLAIGVYGFTISFAGTVLFCAAAFLLHASPFRSFVENHKISFILESTSELPGAVSILNEYSQQVRQLNVQLTRENVTRYDYGLSLKKNVSTHEVMEKLKLIPGIKQVRITVNEPGMTQ
jgi:uncharacterized membrane protein YhiD involved in acid resistance